MFPAATESEGAAREAAAVESSALVRSHHPAHAAKQEPAPLQQLPEHLQQIRFRLELCVPIPRFTLRHLQHLAAGGVVVTEHSSARDMVLTAAGERLLLVELEAVELQLAARVKRLL